ncbi:MAG: hypothetical protein RIS52_504 [Pseudomonadota bacterium]|jgi:uncharacterized surface protein with fasciclin (FAS1) repeats
MVQATIFRFAFTFTALPLLLAAAPPDIMAKPDVGEMPAAPSRTQAPTIMDILSQGRDFSTLVSYIKIAGLESTLASPGPITLFAPSNAAFEKLPESARDTLAKPENKSVVAQILSHHALAGDVSAAELTSKVKAGGGAMKLTTLAGQTITAELVGTALFLVDASGNRARVSQADLHQSNGTIHVIDSILLPQPQKK